QVLVVAGALLPALHHLVDRDLTGADVLRRELCVVAATLDAIPGIGAVGAVVRYAVPLGEVARMILGRRSQLGIELQGLQPLVAAVLVDDVARLLGIEARRGVVSVG